MKRSTHELSISFRGQVAGLLVLAFVVLSFGSWEMTAPTGKDEYYLDFRTPMFMMERDVWLLPWIDDHPRIAKPPMLYWLTRASYEVFGISLWSARLVGVLFGCLMVWTISLLGRELGRDEGFGILSGLVSLSMAGMVSDGGRLMLDLPVATFSALSFLFFLKFWRERKIATVVSSAVFAAAGFLTKGPIVFIVFGGGVLAWLVACGKGGRWIRANTGAVTLWTFVFLLLASSWFIYVWWGMPEVASDILGSEVGKRQFPRFSLTALGALALIGLPWTFVWPAYAGRKGCDRNGGYGDGPPLRFLFLWLILSVVPFLFIRTFERYLLGSIVPLSLICAAALAHRQDRWFIVGARAGAVIGGCLGVLFSAFALWFGTGTAAGCAGLIATLWYGRVWWKAHHPVQMILGASLLWSMLLGYVYPSYGVNGIPPDIISLLRDKPVVLYGGPQPAMLSIVLGRGLWRTRNLGNVPEAYGAECEPVFIAVAEDEESDLLADTRKNGYRVRRVAGYSVPVSHGSWMRFGRKNATSSDWMEALQKRSLKPVLTEILIYSGDKEACARP